MSFKNSYLSFSSINKAPCCGFQWSGLSSELSPLLVRKHWHKMKGRQRTWSYFRFCIWCDASEIILFFCFLVQMTNEWLHITSDLEELPQFKQSTSKQYSIFSNLWLSVIQTQQQQDISDTLQFMSQLMYDPFWLINMISYTTYGVFLETLNIFIIKA